MDFPILLPVPFFISIINSAIMLTAISSGVSAFNSSPIGEVTLVMSLSLRPFSRSFSTQTCHRLREPMTPMYSAGVFRMAGKPSISRGIPRVVNNT